MMDNAPFFARSIAGARPVAHIVSEWSPGECGPWCGTPPCKDPHLPSAKFAAGHAAGHLVPEDSESAPDFCDQCLLADFGFAVYRLFDADGALLYIGSSTNLVARFEAHRVATRWWHEVRSYSLDFYTDVVSLRAAEKAAIYAEFPLYNIRGKAAA